MALPKYKESFVVTMVDKYCAINEAISPNFAKSRKNLHNKWNSFKETIVTNSITF